MHRKHTLLIYSLSLIIFPSIIGMQLIKKPAHFKKNFIRTVIAKSVELDAMRQAWRINNSPQGVVDISQGKIKIKEEIPLGKRYGTAHNYTFTNLMGIVGKAPVLLNITGQRDYFAYAEIKPDGKKELSGLSILGYFDIIDGKSIQPGDIAIYVSDDQKENIINRIEHTGIVVGDDCIESKWGPINAIFEHPIWYVPAAFGNQIVYCRLKIEKARLLEEVQKKLQHESIKKKYAESAYKKQQELFGHIKQYAEDRSHDNLCEIYATLEYSMNVHLDVVDENYLTPWMHADNIGCTKLKELFAAYQAHRE